MPDTTMWQHESLAELDEATLVERLVNDAHWRWRLFNVKGIDSSSVAHLRVPMSGLPTSPLGDVDVLLVPGGRPDQAVAIEMKRIKVRNGDANKLQEFAKGVRQANRLSRVGFHQTYLYILVAVDSRVVNAGRVSYDDGMSPELHSLISQLISPRDLEAGVGLMHEEFVQPMDHEPLTVGSYGGHLVRLAQPRTQPPEVIAWVTGILEAVLPNS